MSLSLRIYRFLLFLLLKHGAFFRCQQEADYLIHQDLKILQVWIYFFSCYRMTTLFLRLRLPKNGLGFQRLLDFFPGLALQFLFALSALLYLALNHLKGLLSWILLSLTESAVHTV